VSWFELHEDSAPRRTFLDGDAASDSVTTGNFFINLYLTLIKEIHTSFIRWVGLSVG